MLDNNFKNLKSLIFKVNLLNKKDEVVFTAQYEKNITFSDIELELLQELSNNKQLFNGKISNLSEYENAINLQIYIAGKLYKSLDYYLMANESLNVEYFIDDIKVNDYVYFVINSSSQDSNLANNRTGFYSLKNESPISLSNNVYLDLMKKAIKI